MCEILLTTMIVILIIVPIAAILITVEIMTRRRVQGRGRNSVGWKYNPYALAHLQRTLWVGNTCKVIWSGVGNNLLGN